MTSSMDLFQRSTPGQTEFGSTGILTRSWHNQPPVLHQLVRAEARRTPDRMAAVYEDQWISYGALVTRSGSWANHLRRLGVETGMLVGIYMERSLELPAIVLAVLEAGGICVPLEPSDPQERVAAMIRETQPAVVLTHSRLRQQIPTTTVPLVIVDQETVENVRAPDVPLTGNNLAFVLLTSGSTGVPKGVMLSHASIAARMFRNEGDLPAPGSCMAIMKTPISNSPFLGEMFASLLHGCYFVIARPGGHQDIGYLGGLIIDYGVSHIAMTSALLSAFLEWPGVSRCRSLKAVSCGGEAVSDALRVRFAECLSEARLIVTYGTTEAGHKLSCECRADEPFDGIRVGRPIQGAHVSLLDSDLKPVSSGELGELYLGGPRLASGYLNRRAWTAERFVPHPFSTTAGERLYRSGDLGCLHADGQLEFKGRIDHQVKIRGNRVELLDVETALAACPGIREAVVLARTNDHGNTHLVAYIVPKQKPGPSVHEMREQLGKKLPLFMVPHVFVALDEIPLTPSGKQDRKALLAMDPDDRDQHEKGYVPPHASMELILADIWREILGVERVGLNDNFFILGGDSFGATRACAEIERRLHRRISLPVFFGAPILKLLGEAVANEKPAEAGIVIVPLRATGSRPPLFLMPSIIGFPSLWRDLLRCLDAEQPVFALGLAGDAAPWSERATVPEIASHFVTALRDANVQGPLHLMGYSFGGILGYEIACQLHHVGIEVSHVVILDTGPGRLLTHSWREVLRNLPLFFANVPRWLSHFVFKTSPLRQIAGVPRKLGRGARRILQVMGGPPPKRIDDGTIDMRLIPQQVHNRMEATFAAVRSYMPGAYAGHIVLFRTKTRPLFHGLSPDLGWGQFVTGGIEVISIMGTHANITMMPAIQVIAERLQTVLDKE